MEASNKFTRLKEEALAGFLTPYLSKKDIQVWDRAVMLANEHPEKYPSYVRCTFRYDETYKPHGPLITRFIDCDCAGLLLCSYAENGISAFRGHSEDEVKSYTIGLEIANRGFIENEGDASKIISKNKDGQKPKNSKEETPQNPQKAEKQSHNSKKPKNSKGQ